MLKFIKMKQHEGYLLYYSVLFVVIVVLTVIKKCSANWSQRWKLFENSSGSHFFMSLVFDQRRWKLRQVSHLRKEVTIKLISARFSKSINLIQSWTTLFVKKIKLKKNEIKQERSLIPQSNRFVGD